MWSYNVKLGRWYHPTGATSENPPEATPEAIALSGWGDKVSRVIKAVSNGKIKECPGCLKRREDLNKLGEFITSTFTRQK